MNQTKIYVGNLSYQTSSDDLHDAFGGFGEISELKLITDRDTGRSKGFAFITFADADAATASLKLDGSTLDNRQVRVNLAKEDRDRPAGGGAGGRRRPQGGGGNFRGGYGDDR